MPGPSAFTRPHDEFLQTAPVGPAVAELARLQHGAVGTKQLLALGLTKDSIAGWKARGGLHRLHRGVYAVGHTALTRRGRWMAALLASGEGAVLSHSSATALWGIRGSGVGEVHVTVPRKVRSHGAIRRHFGILPKDELTVRYGISVTSAARAVLDLAADKGEAAAETALREMEYLRIYGAVSLPVLLDRYPRHRGRPVAQVCLERLRDDPSGRIRSTLEEVFLPFLDEHRIPRPRLNAWLSVGEHRYQVDCLWPEARLVGELDGFKSHGTKRAFRKDRKRDRRLTAHGFHVVRITEDQLLDESAELAADLRVLLATPR
jgi:very-short-patch-repair endonuclease